jgi:Sulfotransferase family
VPRNCIILGSGRSGTSLTAGFLAGAGYFMGDNMNVKLRRANPKGVFEDREVNEINEVLVKRAVRHYRHNIFNKIFRRAVIRSVRLRVMDRHRWMIALPLSIRPTCDPDLAGRISALAARQPYCFKDPLFSYTLGAWRPFLGDPPMLCVFRDPAVTAASIVTVCEDAASLATNSEMDFRKALDIWEHMYRHILKIHYPQGGQWLFLHYDQVMRPDGRKRLEEMLEVKVDGSFADEELRRSKPGGPVPERIGAVYRRLCELAGYSA